MKPHDQVLHANIFLANPVLLTVSHVELLWPTLEGVKSMATKAFILIETVVGKNRDVVAKIQQIKGIKSADSVTGPYDVIAVIEAHNITEIVT